MSNGSVLWFLITLFVTICWSTAFGGAYADPDKVHAWTKEEVDVLRSLWIGSLPPPPTDASNRYCANEKAAQLGAKIFFDKRFSKNGKVSCGTCHKKHYSFTEDMPRAHGIGSTVRRTQPIIGPAYLSWFFWDGRADSLWAQALGPPENPNEHGVTRTLCAQIVSQYYKYEYEDVFGPLPDFPREACPPTAKPDPEDKEAHRAWTSMPSAKAEEITRVYVNIGKAIAAFERQIVPGPSRFDRYVEAILRDDSKEMAETLDAKEVGGLRLFIQKDGCVQCHSGPLLTNGDFRKTGLYQPVELPPDAGRAEGIKKVLSSEFNCLGKYSDAGSHDCNHLKSLDTDTDKYAGAFKVPTLRNVAEREPYMHAGQYWALWEVLRFYSRMKPSPDLSPEFRCASLGENEATMLEAFLRTLSGALIIPEYEGVVDDDGHHHH
jgi:cytochrome c peroxidase